jgi:glucan biosynthesis protein C
LTVTVGLGEDSWLSDPSVPWFYVLWALMPIDAWCWSVTMLYVGMRFLDFSNKWTRYGQEAVLSFYVLHYPVVLTIAFYVVQWQAGVTVKMLAVTLGSFVVTLGIYELLVRRVAPLRALFGIKAAVTPPASQPQEAAPASRPGSVTSA